MLTGSNFEMAFGFSIINIIADITFKVINQVRVEHFVDFIFKIKYCGKSFLTEKLPLE